MPSLRGCPLCTGSGGLRYRVNEANIRASFQMGSVAANISLVANIHEKEARRLAPRRTGRLRNLHYRWVGPTSMAPSRHYWVGTKAGYAKFLWGTAGNGSGYIYPKASKFLKLRPIPYSYFGADNPGRVRTRVKGQRRHDRADWLQDAAREAFRIYGILRQRG